MVGQTIQLREDAVLAGTDGPGAMIYGQALQKMRFAFESQLELVCKYKKTEKKITPQKKQTSLGPMTIGVDLLINAVRKGVSKSGFFDKHKWGE
jgi:hypothetical protein